MKRRSFSKSVGAAGLALAGLMGMGSVSSANVALTGSAAQTETTTPIKSQARKETKSKTRIVNEVGGIPLVTEGKPFGLTPKEYGMRYGNGGSKRSNRLRYPHNAKLKRRNNA